MAASMDATCAQSHNANSFSEDSGVFSVVLIGRRMRHGSTHRGSGSVLKFPVSGGALLNLVAFVPTDLDVEESWSAPGDVAALAAAYNGWAKQVRQVIEAIDHTFRWGIYDRAPLKTWSTDRITLLGDAAHAVTPHLGQGANQAVEDAITL